MRETFKMTNSTRDPMMSAPVTAALLYDLVACPHRVSLDLFADTRERDPPNPFVELLWERGSLYEREVISKLDAPFLDLSRFGGEEKERRTWEAMQRGEPLIYSARLQVGDMLGHPDLLRREDSGYVAGDIKSGSGEEGPEESSKPKVHYAVQLGLYTDILERKRVSAGRRAFVWDVHGREVVYDFQAPYGKRSTRTLWQIYEDALSEARGIVERATTTTPAFSAACKLCHWYTKCVAQLKDADDLTTIPELGRSKRDVMRLGVLDETYLAWEKHAQEPEIWHWPGIINFLGYDPHSQPANLPEGIAAYRRRTGLTHRKLANLIGVHECTVQSWERGRHPPLRSGRALKNLMGLIGGVNEPSG